MHVALGVFVTVFFSLERIALSARKTFKLIPGTPSSIRVSRLGLVAVTVVKLSFLGAQALPTSWLGPVG